MVDKYPHKVILEFNRDEDVKIHVGRFFGVEDAHIRNAKGRLIIEAEEEFVNLINGKTSSQTTPDMNVAPQPADAGRGMR